MRPKALLLDLGNVTVRLRFEGFFERLGVACSPARSARVLKAWFDGPSSGHDHYERGFLDGPAWHARWQAECGLKLGYGDWLGLWNGVFVPNKPMEALLSELAGQVRIWGLSNTNAEHLAHLRGAYPVLGLFEGITASCEVGARKPEAALYVSALKALGIAAEEVLYLDDVEAYVKAAEALKFGTFHYRFNDAVLRRTLRLLGFSLPRRPGPARDGK